MAKETTLNFIQVLICFKFREWRKNAGDSRQVNRHTSKAGWMVKRANNEAVSWVGGVGVSGPFAALPQVPGLNADSLRVIKNSLS